MLADSAHIQEKDAEFLAKRHKEFIEPLYGMRHAVRTMDLMVGVPYNKPFDVVPGVRATYVDAGHILGSASVVLDCTEGGKTKRLVFSGDIGRQRPGNNPGSRSPRRRRRADNGVHLREPGPRVGGRSARKAGADGSRNCSAWRPCSHSRVRGRPNAGGASTPCTRW